ncbi:TonB-dependent receptor plug domain-containing protein [Capnocytophaga canimorsus]|nr:TonB-dependent receptor plug domain-containing protein [Capnocytophaga canimorsus]WGU71318.1 TonB-dependent receptor plug domain-containing protein [Capnocytophaga canimorsus]
MPRLSVVFLIIFLSFTLSLSYGQDLQTHKDSVDYKLGEVVISATRTLRQLSSLPLQVQLIKEKEIRSTNASRLSEVLAEQNGLVTIPGHTGGEGIQMQGLDVAYTLILIDEMPLVGRVLGQLDLNRISVGNIQQVEIVKGASSSLYGSEALGGVINVITKIPEDGLKASVNYKESRFATHDASMNIGYRKKTATNHFFF